MGFELIFERFSTSTVIRVFNFIRTSAFVAERLFWIVILVGFAAATIWNVSETIKTFVAEPTASQVSIVSNATGGGLVFPDAILCLEMMPNSFLELYEDSVELVIAKIASSRDLLAELSAKLERVHNQEVQRSITLNTSFHNQSIYSGVEIGPLRAYHQFEPATADVFDEDDVALICLTSVMLYRLMDLELDPSPKHPEWQSPAVKKLYEAYVANGTNFDNLFVAIAQSLCALLQIRIVTSYVDLQSALSFHTPYDVCKQADVNFLGISYSRREMICYRLRGATPFVFQSAFDYVTLTAHSRALYGQLARELREITIDLSGHFQTDRQRSFRAMFNQKQTLEFALETESTLADLRRRPCTVKEKRKGTQAECIFWCRLEAIIAGCACMPLARQIAPEFSTLPESLKSCVLQLDGEFSGSSHTTCRSALAHRFSTQNCSQSCPQTCETLVFGGPVLLRSDDDQSQEFLNVSTAMKLVSSKFVYLEILEFITMDGKALIASLGGNLSLYLGASFLALIHIIVFFVRLPFERKPTAGGGSTSASSNTQTVKELVKKMAVFEERLIQIQEQKSVASPEKLNE